MCNKNKFTLTPQQLEELKAFSNRCRDSSLHVLQQRFSVRSSQRNMSSTSNLLEILIRSEDLVLRTAGPSSPQLDPVSKFCSCVPEISLHVHLSHAVGVEHALAASHIVVL